MATTWFVVCFDRNFTIARKSIDNKKVIRIYEIATPNSHADALTLADRMERKYKNRGINHIRATPNKPYYSPKTHYVHFEVLNDINSVWNF
jgi:hypothetical protein